MPSFAPVSPSASFTLAASLSHPPTSDSSSTPYILHIARAAAISSSYIIATSSPSAGFSTLDASTFAISGRLDYGAKRGRVTELKVREIGGADDGRGSAVIASFAEGASVGVWDLRGGANARPAIELKGPEQLPILCFDVAQDGWTVATGSELKGSDAFLDLWDLRNPAVPTVRFSDAHSDDITSVAFSPPSLASATPLLLSASSAGLLALHDPAVPDEDDAFLHATDVGASIARAGFFSSSSGTPGVWARTDMDTLGGWEVDGLGKVEGWEWGRAKAEEVGRPTGGWTEVVDYVVGVENVAEGRLAYLGGSQTGDVALIALDDPRPREVIAGLRGGHSDIVRCADIDKAGGAIVTGGEDGRLCLWKPPSSSDAFTPPCGSHRSPAPSGGKKTSSVAEAGKAARFRPY